tara:strand:- start:1701 stop:3305 length:1605 start_codon:yes stop_codon:yes gene_type:complete
MIENKEREYISLEVLLKRSDTNPVNKKFFELLEESATKEEFTEKWHPFIDEQKDTEECLDFSNFKFDINNQETKNTFKFFATRRGRWDFSNITFFNANFANSTFEGDAKFWNSTFEGDVHFLQSTFKGKVHFLQSTFKGRVHVLDSAFKGNAYFHESTFEGDAKFWNSTFEGDVNFLNSTFEGNANFQESTFEVDAKFESLNLEISYSNILTKLTLSRDKEIKDFFDKQDQKEILKEIKKLSNDSDKGEEGKKKIELLLNNFVKHFKKDKIPAFRRIVNCCKSILSKNLNHKTNTLRESLYDLKIKEDISNKFDLSKCSFNKQFLFSLRDNKKIYIQTILDIDATSFTEYTYFNLTKLEKLPNIYKSHISNLQNLRIDDNRERSLKELSGNNDKNNLQFFRKFYKEKLDHHKYLDFSSAELEKKIREDKISYDNIIIWFYKIFSGYGRSIKRPIIVWLIFNFIPLIFRVICNSCKDDNLISYQIFIKSIFPVYFPKSLDNIEVATMIFMWFQTPINLILLFLIGLGIKNRINIK